MFKLKPNPTFEAPVPISEPGGTQRPLRVIFKHKTTSELNDWLAKRHTQTEKQLLDAMVDRVHPADLPEGMTTDDFFRELFENYPAARADVLSIYLRELTESRAKN